MYGAESVNTRAIKNRLNRRSSTILKIEDKKGSNSNSVKQQQHVENG